jgi:tetratricopeptide (TPR) repeat protein
LAENEGCPITQSPKERRKMTFQLLQTRIVVLTATLAVLTFVVPLHAQRGAHVPQSSSASAPAPDEADFTAWSRMQDPDKKIELGQQFAQKYPSSRHTEEVYNELVSAYFKRKDWNDFYATAEMAIAKNPDDGNVLMLVGWVIPHLYNADDPDAAKKLEKAEAYEKHAIEVISNTSRPPNLTDAQFVAAKAALLSQAHSGLGLVYFRNQDYENSVKELQQATQTATSPDPTDIYAMAVGLEQLNRYSEAVDAFQKCSAVPGGLQSRCSASAVEDKTKAAQPK